MFRRRTAASDPHFNYILEGDELILTLVKSRHGAALPVSQWPAIKSAAAATLTALMAANEDDRRHADGRPLVQIADDRIRLHPAWVAAMDASSAETLGLPPVTPLALDLRPVGRIDQVDFTISTRWVRPGGSPIRVLPQGAILTGDSGPRRIPEPLWSLYNAACILAEPTDKEQRFRALAELRTNWPEDALAHVESTSYLSDLRVHYASGLSLKLGRLGPFDFDPVLFGRQELAEAEDDARSLDEDNDSILTSASQKLFAEDRFRRERTARPVYVLRDGEYVFIDPALLPVLSEVRSLQDAPEPARRAFVLNPRKVLRERLGEAIAEQIGVDRLFTETEQFSARVAGVDVWRAPVLPWLTPAVNNSWLPERFGLRVGDDYFVTPPEHIRAVIKSLEDASAAGEAVAAVPGLLEPYEVGGTPAPAELPVTEQMLASVRSLAPFAKVAEGKEINGSNQSATVEQAVRGKLFLIIRDNIEEVEFAHFEPSGVVPTRADEPAIPFVMPSALRATLKPHQLVGLKWLVNAVEASRPGALLADDMGLGKTVQAIAFMAWLQECFNKGRLSRAPFLIVAPTGLLSLWRDEIARHLNAPRLGALLPAFGARLKELREEDGFSARDIDTGRAALSAEAWRDAGVVLTTYETLRDYHFSFARTRFALIIYDEVQKLKNPASQMTRAAKTLNADFILAMTGTPVENRLQDLWSIMDVVAPGLLGSSRDFERHYPSTDRPALAKLKAKLTEASDGRPAYMLRRMKSDHLADLPRKTVHKQPRMMPQVQADAYRDLVTRAAAGVGMMGKGGMLSTLASMRGVSLHPLDPRQAPTDLVVYARDSARLSWTLEILDEVAAKHERALVFVEDLAMQERLVGLIKAHFGMAEAPMRINGAVPGMKRQALVDRFQADAGCFGVMILSPKAGGVGLTLTAANHVIHLSRWWNPAVEDQATDRLFRIGQTREVHVYLPLAVHPDPLIRESSFDLRLDALIDRKRGLTNDLFLPPDSDDSDLADLFREVSLTPEAGPEIVAPSTESSQSETQDTIQPVLDAVLGKPILTLSKASPTDLGAKVWRVPAGDPKPTDEILTLFAGRDLTHVLITDPYALAALGSRRAQVRFVADLAKSARSLTAVTVVYAAEVDGDLSDPDRRRDFLTMFNQAFTGGGPKLHMISRRRQSGYDDFHDRTVDITVRHAGGAERRHALIIGRGAEALYDQRKQCTVTYAPPGGSP